MMIVDEGDDAATVLSGLPRIAQELFADNVADRLGTTLVRVGADEAVEFFK